MIYLVTNRKNGKRYIGKTSRGLNVRWYHHCRSAKYGSLTYFHRAIRKYGDESFELAVLDEEYSNAAERRWIEQLRPEYNMTEGGDGGWIHDQTGNRWKVSDSSRMGKSFREGNHHSSNWRESVSGGNNYQCIYTITTPWGVFETWKDATTQARKLRSQGRRDVVTDVKTLQLYCKQGKILSDEGRRTYPPWRGKHTHDIGFGCEER